RSTRSLHFVLRRTRLLFLRSSARSTGDRGSAPEGAGEFDFAEWSLPGTGGEPVAGRVRMGSGFPAELPPHFVTYFAVTDCDAALETLVRLGGRVHHGPLDTPSGRYASVSDDQGAGFAVVDTSRRTGAGPS
ncbi:hypothetical protein ACFW9F_04605, partial [Streptomyces sp. NPDC059506]